MHSGARKAASASTITARLISCLKIFAQISTTTTTINRHRMDLIRNKNGERGFSGDVNRLINI